MENNVQWKLYFSTFKFHVKKDGVRKKDDIVFLSTQLKRKS